ncbi:MAG: mechanosensitive ion channel family protein [Coleofasciculus sp. Co-bin14]|nr:mechanosensitive ion channel family protein [Coleofasciculus sp. Co-bin14]
MFQIRFSSWTIAGTINMTGFATFPVQAQVPFFPDLNLPSQNLLNQNLDNRTVSGCIRLDGRCLFKIADQKSDLPNRINSIEQRLNDISSTYFSKDTKPLQIRKEQEGNLPNIYISVGNKEVRLMSVTAPDAELEGVNIDQRTDQIIEQLEEGVRRAKQERQTQFLTRQGGIAAGTGVAMLITSLIIYRWERQLKRSKDQLSPSDSSPTQPVSTQLTQKQEWNVKEVQHRLFQLVQPGILGGGTLFILGLFPHTRILQVLIISSLRIPLRVGFIGLGTYVIVRLSYALIDRFASVLARNYLLTPESNRRVQLRVSTISSVTKGIVTVTLIGVGIITTLSTLGINIAPLLAGAGILGVGLSLASQNLIKDAINGFFIILEDQYAVGDVINVANVGGLVENMNLRITQLRDAEGRLITIPNSEIKVVANLSSTWSRADLPIPIAYYADVDKALEVIDRVAQDMSKDGLWRDEILDKPEVLGVDDFGVRGVIIRVWIKTQPLKQWVVAREFRRLLKVALDQAGISIPMPQQEVWFSNSLPMKSSQDGRAVSSQTSTH